MDIFGRFMSHLYQLRLGYFRNINIDSDVIWGKMYEFIAAMQSFFDIKSTK